MAKTRPWDLFINPDLTTEEKRDERYAICKACPHFIAMTRQCSECGCFMKAKTWLRRAECPVGKWGEEPETPKGRV